MQTDAWLNQDDDFTPGRVLFRSERTFQVWAYSLSHSQLRSGALPSSGPEGSCACSTHMAHMPCARLT